jgi:hypothetical protein
LLTHARREALVRTRLRLAMALVTCLGTVAGCGYSIRPPYNAAIRTIYLPVAKSYRFRQDLNIQLTELIRQEINDRTPYRVVGDPDRADARLEAEVTFDDKNVLVENPYNLPRHILATMSVNVTYTDNRGGGAKSRTFPAAMVSESAPFYPEIGEPTRAGFEKVMRRIARDIVNMMEEPWGDEFENRDGLASAAEPSEPAAARIRR